LFDYIFLPLIIVQYSNGIGLDPKLLRQFQDENNNKFVSQKHPLW